MIPNNFIEFYGDQTRWFLGEVVDVNDPKQLGRVKVKVHGVYDEIEDGDLPWAQIVVPVTTGIHEGKGQNLGILVGTQVFGMFLDGKNSQLPMVIGTVPKEKDTGKVDPKTKKPITEPDTNSKALENYPYNKVYQTESGHYKEWDDTEGKERIREQHTSGTYYEIQPDGSRITIIEVDDSLIVKGDCLITVVGNATIAGNNVSVNAAEKATVSAKNVSVIGTDTVTVRGGNKVKLG